ncbi:MAG: hypothetical protein AAFW69_08390 [Pseudomonadota bacterium]
MTAPAWDAEEQHLQTAATVAHLLREGAVAEGACITLDVQIVPQAGAGPLARAGLLAALSDAGYAFADAGDGVEVAVPDVAVSTEAIWAVESALAELALRFQWVPDGWGFLEPE